MDGGIVLHLRKRFREFIEHHRAESVARRPIDRDYQDGAFLSGQNAAVGRIWVLFSLER